MDDIQNFIKKIPEPVLDTAQALKNAHYEAYLVGGCVRDLLLGRKPKDWDITTNATPEQIVALFPRTFYENDYGTVGVVLEEENAEDQRKDIDETLRVIEITPYRLESGYADKRHPDQVIFTHKITDDLNRRDFTINAIALDPHQGHIVDIAKGHDDIKDRILRTVGDSDARFQEDALRILRAIRFSTELNFEISPETEKSILDNASLLEHISRERVRDEFARILMSDNPKRGLELAHKFHVLHFITPELEKAVGVEQGGVHAYDVWEHLLRSLQLTADKKWPLEIRLAALFHDIGKPVTKREGEHKPTFYGHEVVGAKMTKKILTELKFPQKVIEKVVKLVRWHMFFSDTEEITHSAVRRLVANVGQENVWDLMNVRIADRIGTGRPKEEPYRLRKYQSMIEEVMTDPVSVGMLKIDGKRIMEVTHETPGRKIGYVLHALLEEVIEDPKLNTPEYLEGRATLLVKLPVEELQVLGDKGKQIKEEEEEKQVEEIRKKYHVE
ncbi:MAG: CCA tRNA nucleotidyltransferase [bacterium]|nr:CCA tRNA nucleotidyltransferase [bacterium]